MDIHKVGSQVRQKITKPIEEIQVGDSFCIVNTLMHGAVPGSPTFQKTGEYTAMNLETMEDEIMRPCTLVEIA